MAEITYTSNGMFLVPNLTIDEPPKKELGRFGLMRKNYLREYKSGIFDGMLSTGKLMPHLMEIDETADRRMEQITSQMMEREGVNESLKAKDQMLWIQMMENIQNRAEEIILSELIYT